MFNGHHNVILFDMMTSYNKQIKPELPILFAASENNSQYIVFLERQGGSFFFANGGFCLKSYMSEM
jgi:hypothetical protein